MTQLLTRKLFKFNIFNKSIKNIKENELFNFISNAIQKTLNSNFDLVAAIFDGRTSNRKCIHLLVESDEIQDIITKLPTPFMKNNKCISIIFCIIHNIKYI